MAKHIIKTVETDELTDDSGYKIAKTAILYLVASLVLAAVVVPLTNVNTQQLASAVSGDIDRTVTGSVEKKEKKRTRIRRSVLQANPAEPCYVFNDGQTEGDC